MTPFERFGPAHLTALAITMAAAVVAIGAGRHPRAGKWIRIALSIVLGTGVIAYFIIEGMRGRLSGLDFLPLHLSDFAVFLAIFALLTLRQRAAELLYFLAIAELLAILTPDLGYGFRDPLSIIFFILHGGTLVGAVLLTFGFRLMPEKGAVLRALLFLNGYAGFVALMNAMLETNFLYLRHKPAQPSPLDWMGPWPWYLVSAEIVAAILFLLAYAPFRRADQPGRAPGTVVAASKRGGEQEGK